jgi:PAS domain S-box-containing protein
MLSQYAGNVLHAVLGALAVRPFVGSPPRLDDLRSMAAFVLLAAIAAPAVASAVTVYLFMVNGWTPDYWLVWRQRFLSQILGAITVTPLILITIPLGFAAWLKVPLKYCVELSLLTIGLLAVGIPVFSWKAPGAGSFPGLLFAPLPFLLWAAVRLGPGALCFLLLVVALLSLANTFAGRGPFSTLSAAENILSLQIFLIAISVPLMFLAALIEERRTKEDALEESEERFRNMADYAPVMVWVADPNGSCSFLSKSWYEFTGQTLETGLGFGWLDAVHPDDRESARATFVAANDRREPFRLDYRLRGYDGKYCWVIDSAAPRFGPQGDFLATSARSSTSPSANVPRR